VKNALCFGLQGKVDYDTLVRIDEFFLNN
jgi:hypothetical protein